MLYESFDVPWFIPVFLELSYVRLVIILQRFQLRNKRGHSSDSSVQRLLYGDTYGSMYGKQSISSVTEETFVG